MASRRKGWGGLADYGPKKPTKKPEKPRNTVPMLPPYGSYDPALDQQERSATRGLGYLIDDIRLANERGLEDLDIGEKGIERGRGRSLADLMTARTRAQQDARTQTEGLQRDYTRLGNSQQQAAAASGNLGGAIAQARRKRAANQAVDQSSIDTNLSRFLADNTLSTGRLNEDADIGLEGLHLDFNRGFDDRRIQGTRATDENRIFGLDINETRIDQAKQAGLLPASFGGSQKPAGAKPGPSRKPRKRYGRMVG